MPEPLSCRFLILSDNSTNKSFVFLEKTVRPEDPYVRELQIGDCGHVPQDIVSMQFDSLVALNGEPVMYKAYMRRGYVNKGDVGKILLI